jgi:hypothetical protein
MIESWKGCLGVCITASHQQAEARRRCNGYEEEGKSGEGGRRSGQGGGRLYIVTKSYLLENLGGDIVRPGYSLKQLLDINCPTCDGHL